MTLLHADLKLAQRLEAVDADVNREAVAAAARLLPELGACAAPFMGGWAMFDGPQSPITQCFGLGLKGRVSGREMNDLEDFFRSRGAPCNIELCPHADASLVELLGKRGYRVLEYSNVLVRPLPGEPFAAAAQGIALRPVPRQEAKDFAGIVMGAFFSGTIPPGMESLMAGSFISSNGCESMLATVDGIAAGGASYSIVDGVLDCYGDGTLERFRGRGIQSALIATRLEAGIRAGAELAMATTMPGTVSQRNYERAGFRVVYTRCKFTREWTRSI